MYINVYVYVIIIDRKLSNSIYANEVNLGIIPACGLRSPKVDVNSDLQDTANYPTSQVPDTFIGMTSIDLVRIRKSKINQRLWYVRSYLVQK